MKKQKSKMGGPTSTLALTVKSGVESSNNLEYKTDGHQQPEHRHGGVLLTARLYSNDAVVVKKLEVIERELFHGPNKHLYPKSP